MNLAWTHNTHLARNRGLVVLLMTSLLLIVSLSLSLTSYRALFYQHKLTQNRIEAQQRFWLLEGAIACGFSTLQTMNIVQAKRQPAEAPIQLALDAERALARCGISDDLVLSLLSLGQQRYQVIAQLGLYRQQRSFRLIMPTDGRQQYQLEWIAGSWYDLPEP